MERWEKEREALKHMAKGEWLKAYKIYEELANSEKDSNLYNITGDILVRIGKYNEALYYYQLAIDNFLANYLFTSAIAILNKIKKIFPNKPYPFIKSSYIHAKSKNFQECEENLKKAIELVLSEKDKEEILKVLEILVESEEKELKDLALLVYEKLGIKKEEFERKLMKLSSQEQEVEVFQVEKQSPMDSSTWSSPQAYLKDALIELSQAVEENEELWEHTYERGRILFEAKLYKEAIDELQDYLVRNPNHKDALILLGKAFFEVKERILALKAFEEALKLTDDEKEKMEVLYLIARTHEALGERDEALRIYRELLFKDIDFKDTKWRMEQLLRKKRRE